MVAGLVIRCGFLVDSLWLGSGPCFAQLWFLTASLSRREEETCRKVGTVSRGKRAFLCVVVSRGGLASGA